MRELSMSELTMRELTTAELQQVSGGWTMAGAALTLAGAFLAVAAICIGVIGAPIWGVFAGALALGGVVVGVATYIVEGAPEHTSTPTGVVTIEELQQTTSVQESDVLQQTTSTLDTTSDSDSAIAAAEGDMGYIGYVDAGMYS